jgi:ABC-type transport system involved in multi-copper enzyme maturation permease subunit
VGVFVNHTPHQKKKTTTEHHKRRDAMSTNESLLVPSHTRGWRMGLVNVFTKEISSWLRTRRWWMQCLLALSLLNGTFMANVESSHDVLSAGLNFLMIAAWAAPFVAMLMGQDSILVERHSGTAAWLLSKPLRRPAFILAKLIANGLGLLATWVVLPGGIAYLQLRAYGMDQLSGSGYAAAMGLVYLNLLFYLTLALMLATLFNGRGPGLGIALLNLLSCTVFIEPTVKYAPWLLKVMPWNLLLPFGYGANSPLAGYLMLETPLPTVTPIIATAVWCVLFVGVALWRFRREEF